MLKKEITYTDFYGKERKETFCFNLSKGEISRDFLKTEGSLVDKLSKIVNAKDNADIMDTFENLIRKSYGEISEDGRRFTKKDDNGNWLFEKFAETPAYDILFMELLSDEKKAVEFVKGVLDPELQKEVAAAQAAEANKQLQFVTK
jgi:hypothetical protein